MAWLKQMAAMVLDRRGEQLKILLDRAPLGVYLVDADFRLREVNPIALPVFGDIPGGVIGRDFDEVIHILWEKEYADEIVGLFRHTLATGEPYFTPEWAELRMDRGIVEYYEWRIDRIPLPDGRPGVVCYFRDISGQVAARHAVAETAERLRLALDTAAMGTFVWHVEEDRGEPDERLLALFGQPADGTLSYQTVLAGLIHPDDIGRFKTAIATATDPEEPGVMREDLRIVHPDGSVHWLSVTGQTSFGGVPRRALRMVGMAADITERRLAEERLRRVGELDAFRVALADALRPLTDPFEIESEAARVLGEHLGTSRVLYAQLVSEADCDYYVVTKDYCVPGVARITGRYRADDFGAALFAALRAGRTLAVNDVAVEPRLSERERAAYPALGTRAFIAVPLLKDGRHVAMMGVQQLEPRAWTSQEIALLEETAERTWAAVERARAEEALREADRRKDEFLATLAHELRNPLAPLCSGLEVLKLARGSRKAEPTLAVMERQLGQMVRLIDDLLDVSRISSGKIDLHRERAELSKIVEQSLETSGPLIEDGHHALTVIAPATPIFVDADVTRLAQVFSNLLNNAAKYTGTGGGITLEMEERGGEAVVRVRDNGIGIPAPLLSKVFDRFIQVDRSPGRAQGGLGLGLSLVKGLVEMHGGSVEAKSAGHGLGSELVVRLPLAEAQAPPERPPLPVANTLPPAVRRRILVVDDNRDAADSLALMLRRKGHTTHTAYDGLEALDAAVSFHPDLILLDIGMPNLDGHETARYIRLQPWGRSMMLVALTGWGQEEDRRRSQEAGFDFHLVKPVRADALDQLLARLPAPDAPAGLSTGVRG